MTRLRRLGLVAAAATAACSLLDPLDDIAVGADDGGELPDASGKNDGDSPPEIDGGDGSPPIDAGDSGDAECQPPAFAGARYLPRGLVATESHVYWLEGPRLPVQKSAVYRKSRAGGAVEKSYAEFLSARGLAVSATHVFILYDLGGCSVGSISLSSFTGDFPATVFHQSSSCSDLNADVAFDEVLFTIGVSGTAVKRIFLDGGSLDITNSAVEARYVAANGGRVYWYNGYSATVNTMNGDGGGYASVVSGAGGRAVHGVAASTDFLWVLTAPFGGGPRVAQRLLPDGGDAGFASCLGTAQQGQGEPDFAVAPDDGRLYFTNDNTVLQAP